MARREDIINGSKEVFSCKKSNIPGDIFDAIKRCESLFISYTINENGDVIPSKIWSAKSIKKKIADCIDQPFLDFVEQFHFSKPTWKFSELTQKDLYTAHRLLFEWEKEQLREFEDTNEMKCVNIDTEINALRDFLRYSAGHIPGTSNAIAIVNGHLEEKSEKLLRTENKQLQDEMLNVKDGELEETSRTHLYFYHPGFCEVCFERTEANKALLDILKESPKISDEIAKLILENAPVRAKKLSSKYCAYHDKHPNQVTAKKDRLYFYSAMRLIDDLREAYNSRFIEIEDLRRHAYFLTSQRGGKSPLLMRLPNIVDKYHLEVKKLAGAKGNATEDLLVYFRDLEKEAFSHEPWSKKGDKIVTPFDFSRMSDAEWLLHGVLIKQGLGTL